MIIRSNIQTICTDYWVSLDTIDFHVPQARGHTQARGHVLPFAFPSYVAAAVVNPRWLHHLTLACKFDQPMEYRRYR